MLVQAGVYLHSMKRVGVGCACLHANRVEFVWQWLSSSQTNLDVQLNNQ